MKPMLVVNYCGHGQQFIPWPEADGYWVLVPVLDWRERGAHSLAQTKTQYAVTPTVTNATGQRARNVHGHVASTVT